MTEKFSQRRVYIEGRTGQGETLEVKLVRELGYLNLVDWLPFAEGVDALERYVRMTFEEFQGSFTDDHNYRLSELMS